MVYYIYFENCFDYQQPSVPQPRWSAEIITAMGNSDYLKLFKLQDIKRELQNRESKLQNKERELQNTEHELQNKEIELQELIKQSLNKL